MTVDLVYNWISRKQQMSPNYPSKHRQVLIICMFNLISIQCYYLGRTFSPRALLLFFRTRLLVHSSSTWFAGPVVFCYRVIIVILFPQLVFFWGRETRNFRVRRLRPTTERLQRKGIFISYFFCSGFVHLKTPASQTKVKLIKQWRSISDFEKDSLMS